MGSRTVTITLQVEVDGDDVRGTAHATPASDGAAKPFAGWLGLIGAIDALLGFPPDAGAGARALAATEGTQCR